MIPGFDLTTTYSNGDKVIFRGEILTFKPPENTSNHPLLELRQFSTNLFPCSKNNWYKEADIYGCNKPLDFQSEDSNERFFKPK